MEPKEFLGKLEHDRIVEAIQDVEKKTSAEIRVFINRGELEKDAISAGQDELVRLGMHNTKERNGVLIYIVPRAQEFAVIGDEGIHQKCGAEVWQQVVDKMSEHFGSERFSEAIVGAIMFLGSVLAEHFPRHWRNPNELPDEVIER